MSSSNESSSSIYTSESTDFGNEEKYKAGNRYDFRIIVLLSFLVCSGIVIVLLLSSLLATFAVSHFLSTSDSHFFLASNEGSLISSKIDGSMSFNSERPSWDKNVDSNYHCELLSDSSLMVAMKDESMYMMMGKKTPEDENAEWNDYICTGDCNKTAVGGGIDPMTPVVYNAKSEFHGRGIFWHSNRHSCKDEGGDLHPDTVVCQLVEEEKEDDIKKETEIIGEVQKTGFCCVGVCEDIQLKECDKSCDGCECGSCEKCKFGSLEKCGGCEPGCCESCCAPKSSPCFHTKVFSQGTEFVRSLSEERLNNICVSRGREGVKSTFCWENKNGITCR